MRQRCDGLCAGATDGSDHVGGPVRRVLHVDHRLAVLRRQAIGACRQVLRPVHGQRRLQLSAAGRLLLGYSGRHVRAVRRHLPRGAQAAPRVGDEAAQHGRRHSSEPVNDSSLSRTGAAIGCLVFRQSCLPAGCHGNRIVCSRPPRRRRPVQS